MDNSPDLPSKAEALKRIEEDRLFIEEVERERPKHWQAIREAERRQRRLLQIIRQLARI